MYVILHTDLHYLISEYLDLTDVLRHKIVCKRFKSIKIKDLFNIDAKYLHNLNDHILKQYTDVIELKIRTTNVTNSMVVNNHPLKAVLLRRSDTVAML